MHCESPKQTQHAGWPIGKRREILFVSDRQVKTTS
uniref:Uncharacterized protein n=1 Tax=Anguilla anguilla TaxID=7936 RepID=A0A0E9PK39_ANGAN